MYEVDQSVYLTENLEDRDGIQIYAPKGSLCTIHEVEKGSYIVYIHIGRGGGYFRVGYSQISKERV